MVVCTFGVGSQPAIKPKEEEEEFAGVFHVQRAELSRPLYIMLKVKEISDLFNTEEEDLQVLFEVSVSSFFRYLMCH